MKLFAKGKYRVVTTRRNSLMKDGGVWYFRYNGYDCVIQLPHSEHNDSDNFRCIAQNDYGYAVDGWFDCENEVDALKIILENIVS